MRQSDELIWVDWVDSEEARLDMQMWNDSLSSAETQGGGFV